MMMMMMIFCFDLLLEDAIRECSYFFENPKPDGNHKYVLSNHCIFTSKILEMFFTNLQEKSLEKRDRATAIKATSLLNWISTLDFMLSIINVLFQVN